ncbi:uncharacterized protein [Hetaerina americana]|uniref:uncharacterized protein n=1 Tax=Hetaerina americana TaxID=62018 RepID=UPI003A7F4951
MAVRLGCPPSLCTLLLDAGADVDAPDFYGHSPLWAAVYGKRAGHVALLLARGARVCQWGPGSRVVPLPWNECPLHEAVRQGWQWCQPLVSAGAGLGARGLLRVALDRGDVGTAKGLALAAGLRPSREWAPLPEDDWLAREMTSPPPLSRLCRYAVRACLSRAAGGRDLRPRAPLLPLPPHLVRYVLLDPLGP